MTSVGESDSTPAWWLDEVANAGRENLDADHVSHYDSKEDAGAGDEVQLCQQFGVNGASVVVDLGVGTGQFALAVAPVCARVIAVDVSPVMLETLRAKIAHAQVPNIEVVQAGFLTYDHEGDAPDFVYSRYGLHHLPDFWKAVALTRIHQMLRPGGLFRLWDVVYNFDPIETRERIEDWCSSGTTTSPDSWSRDELEEHVRDEQSTFSWLLEPMLQRAGFAIDVAEYSDDGIFAKYVLRCL